jgi:hypothetical protein
MFKMAMASDKPRPSAGEGCSAARSPLSDAKKTKVSPRNSDTEEQGGRITGQKGGGRNLRPGCAEIEPSKNNKIIITRFGKNAKNNLLEKEKTPWQCNPSP